jgi:hypothetical protein
MDVARGAMEIERLRRLRRLTALLRQYQALPEPQRDPFAKFLSGSQLHGRQSTPEALQHTARNVDSDVFRLANEPLGLESTPPFSHMEHPATASSFAGVHNAEGRADQDLQEIINFPTENPKPSDRTYNGQVIDSDMQSSFDPFLKRVPINIHPTYSR